MRICLICPPGGHLDEFISVFDAFKGHDVFAVISGAETTGKLIGMRRIYYFENPQRPIFLVFYIFSLIFNCVRLILPCIKILIEERPDVIMGCSGEATIIMSYLGKLMGVRLIFLESLTRVHDISISGKLVLDIADLLLVQWSSLTQRYKKAKYWGKVI